MSTPSSYISTFPEDDKIGIQEKETSLLIACVNIEDTRYGSIKDTETLKKTFPGSKIHVFTKFDKEEQEKFFRKLADEGKHHSHIIIYILAHGYNGSFICGDGSIVNIHDFTEKVCLLSSLEGKFKWLCYVCCRINKKDEQNSEQSEPLYENTVISYSTSPGMKSVRYRDEGTLYIKLFAVVVAQHGITKEMFDVLTELVRKKAEEINEKQEPCYTWNLSHDVFYVP